MCTVAKLKIITASVVKSVLLVSDKVEKIILFGSQSRGDSTAESDVDILVVVDELTEEISDLKKLMWKHTNDRKGLSYFYAPISLLKHSQIYAVANGWLVRYNIM